MNTIMKEQPKRTKWLNHGNNHVHNYTDKVIFIDFICLFIVGFSHCICKASLILRSYSVLALSIIENQNLSLKSLHSILPFKCIKSTIHRQVFMKIWKKCFIFSNETAILNTSSIRFAKIILIANLWWKQMFLGRNKVSYHILSYHILVSLPQLWCPG